MRPLARLRVRVLVLVALGALVVAGGIALLLNATVDLRNTSDATISSDRYLLNGVQVDRLVVDAETGLRGYLLTDRPLFLAPLYTARAELPAAYAALARSAGQERAFGSEVSALIGAARSYMSVYVTRELRLAVTDLAVARSVAATAEGKRLVDAIRAQTAALERLVAARQAMRVAQAHHSADRAITEGIVLLVVLTALTLVLGGYLGRLAVGRERAREHAEDTVRALQQSILPAGLPTIPGCEVAVRFLPEGGGLVGGDFYDVFELAPDAWAIIVGDVCGKGPGAAAVSAMARWTLRSFAGSGSSPEDSLRLLNEAMLREPPAARFVTLAYVRLRIEGDEAFASIACAGHPPPVLIPADERPRLVPARGDLLGIWPAIDLRGADLILRPGDGLVLYTDGVTEQRPGERRSVAELMPARAGGATGAQALADAVESVARASSGGRLRDDVAILACHFVGESRGSGVVGAYERGATGA